MIDCLLFSARLLRRLQQISTDCARSENSHTSAWKCRRRQWQMF